MEGDLFDMADDDKANRSDRRMVCPVCEARVVSIDTEVTVLRRCDACNGLGEVCVCPVCEGALSGGDWACKACGGQGWVPVDKWDAAVDKGHEKIMKEVKAEKEQEKQLQKGSLEGVYKAYEEGMSNVAAEWEKACNKMVAAHIDAGAYSQIVGGLTVGYVNDLSKIMKLDRVTMLAYMFNGMLSFMERSGDVEGARSLAGQAAGLLESMMLAAQVRDKGRMN